MKKVLILAPYSYPSKCGVWTRVWEDAKFLKEKGLEVSIFTSDIIKGTENRSVSEETIGGIKVYRFKVLFTLGGSSLFWFFFKKFKDINPDIVHTHGYRHPHSLMSLIFSKIFRKRVFITTHAPFEKDQNRSILLKWIDKIYDLFIGRIELRLYEKVLRISNWEERYLKNLGVKDSIYLPNGISEVFTKADILLNIGLKKRIIFMGRIDPVKRLEWILEVAERLPDYNFFIRGPLNSYKEFKSKLKNVTIVSEKYEATDFIRELSQSDIYVLPSIREALPFTLLEAMSQGVLPLTSNSKGGLEVVTDGLNGYIFASQDELFLKIRQVYANPELTLKMRKLAIVKSKEYSLSKINERLYGIYNIERI